MINCHITRQQYILI